MESIEISEGKVGARRDITLLSVKGYVDTMTCSILLNKITQILQSGVFHIIVDMAQVNYVSSAGWGVFVGEIKGIRERGGDLKIVHMIPEVYDVFEMLEFHRILSYYDSIEEALNDFDLSIGLDITKSMKRSYSSEMGNNVAVADRTMVKRAHQSSPSESKSRYMSRKPEIDERTLPLSEKIKLIVIEDPTRGVLQTKRRLNTQRFGFTKVSIFKVHNILRKFSLETKSKRFRFYRSR